MPTRLHNVERLLDKLEPRIQRAVLALVRRIRDDATLKEIEELLVAGRIDTALRRVGFHAQSLGDEIAEMYVVSADDVAAQIETQIGEEPTFDRTNTRAVDQMRFMRDRVVEDFTREQFLATRRAIAEGIAEDMSPRQLARQFRESIGLTDKQEQAVANFRRLLRAGSSEALTRELRDRRFDRTVERAISGETPLTEAQIDNMATRYRERYLIYRSQVIARTEALTAAHAGSREMYVQGVESGVIDPNVIERTWSTSQDQRVRDSHRAMNGQKRAINDPFISGDGHALMFPGDPSAPLEETVQCRCAILTRIVRR